MFQLAPVQLPKVSLRDSHCCCEPESTWPSTTLSARNPPLDHPLPGGLGIRVMFPLTWTRRIGPAWATAQRSRPSGGTMLRFSAARQKFCVPLPSSHWASTVT